MKVKSLRGLFAALLVACVSAVAVAGDWAEYKDDHYGFSMKMPSGTKYGEAETKDGWGVLAAKHEGVEFLAICKLNEQAKPEEIEKFGVKFTGIAEKHWKEIDKGQDHNGWKWYKTVEASDGHTLIFGGYGTGPKGSYLCLLKTTEEDYKAHKADYKEWYASVKLH